MMHGTWNRYLSLYLPTIDLKKKWGKISRLFKISIEYFFVKKLSKLKKSQCFFQHLTSLIFYKNKKRWGKISRPVDTYNYLSIYLSISIYLSLSIYLYLSISISLSPPLVSKLILSWYERRLILPQRRPILPHFYFNSKRRLILPHFIFWRLDKETLFL